MRCAYCTLRWVTACVAGGASVGRNNQRALRRMWFIRTRFMRCNALRLLHPTVGYGVPCVFHGHSATDSTHTLPPIPRTLCHPFHGHSATDSTVILPPPSASVGL